MTSIKDVPVLNYDRGISFALTTVMWRMKGLCEVDEVLTKDQFGKVASAIIKLADLGNGPELAKELERIRDAEVEVDA